MASKPVLVLKIGTSSITTKNGNLHEPVLQSIAQQISTLHKKYSVVIVSSGAVGTGKKFIKGYMGKINERKAAAAIGNPILINKYTQAFAKYKIPIAQSLCERGHFSDREKFLQLKATYEELWANGIIPIANENDVVSSRELKFSDNDELATLIAVGFGAQHLLMATNVEGVLDKKGLPLRLIGEFDQDIFDFAAKGKSEAGLGGMISKLTFAHLATRMGIATTIFKLRKKDSILRAVEGKTGTLCISNRVDKTARQRWLASGSLLIGKVIVDEGAKRALLNRKSLLAVGIKKLINEFAQHEAFEIAGEDKIVFAVAKAKTGSSQLNSKDLKNIMLANADDIVIL
jgi:glutamate 5-kinase